MTTSAWLGALLAVCVLAGQPERAAAQLTRPLPERPAASSPIAPADSLRPPAGAHPRAALTIEAIELEGAVKTRREVVIAASGLEPGGPATPGAILAAAEQVRALRLFDDVAVHTKRGSRPGAVRVVFTVKERGTQLRFGLGYEDYSGWYLIPAELNFDNLTGRGESFAFQTRFGYRQAGLVLAYRSRARPSPDFWELRGRLEGVNRIYFYDGTEVTHSVSTAAFDVTLGRQVTSRLDISAWTTFENVDVDSTSEVYSDRPAIERESGDPIEFNDLPPAIRSEVGRVARVRLGTALIASNHHGNGLRASGVWSRLSAQGIWSDSSTHGILEADARAFMPAGRGAQLAARLRLGTVSPSAPFYDRFYVGGLYTVRGFPSNALSPPGGHGQFATASLELRGTWVGPADNPRFAGLLFADAGLGWNGSPAIDDVAVGAGYGFRLRLPWIGYLGLDIGAPLTPSPVNEAYHANFSLGWSF